MNFLIYPREVITNNGGKGGDNRGNRRRPFRRRGNNGQEKSADYKSGDYREERQNRQSSGKWTGSDNRSGEQRSREQRYPDNASNDNKPDFRSEHKSAGQKNNYDRPKWIPPQIPSMNLPAPECPCCGKPIRDIMSAFTDKNSGQAAHFDCIIARITERETLEKGEFVSYIGGGRFGIVRMNNPADVKKFTIKKILEWENKDDRPQWLSAISDHYSVT